MAKQSPPSWLMLIHQIPPKPDAFRVKIWRRLQQVGAVAVKQSVYILPDSESAYEDFSWILKEIVQAGGEAYLTQCRFVEGITGEQVIFLFQHARRADYQKLMDDVNALRAGLEPGGPEKANAAYRLRTQIGKLQNRLDAIAGIDFFTIPERIAVENTLADLLQRLKGTSGDPTAGSMVSAYTGKTWVTRKQVFVDRMACAWLIRRFIDKEAIFKFVDHKTYHPQKDEIRFDMFDAEFTHVGDRCSFETMIERLAIKDNALSPIAEIVHDIDMKDSKFGRPEIDGIAALLAGIASSMDNDRVRLDRGSALFDDLYAYFKSKK
jgi:hypothetical protein